MKKILNVLLFLTLFSSLSAEISVKSFRKLENDMTARIDAKKIDQNGDVCAIIKVVTTQTGFIWEPDGLGIISAENKGGEYWLYVPYGAKRLTIKHPQLGVLRDYLYNIPIEKASVYEMVLTTGKVITTVEETIESQWLVITSEPTDAAIYIEDAFVKTGTYQTKLKPGSYSYRIEAPLYHTEAGKVEITDSKRELAVKLNPAFGFIQVNSEPEKDAKVIIDGKTLTLNTPCKSEALSSGEHTVQLIKEMYQSTSKKINVTDGLTIPITFTLQPNFAELTLSSMPSTKLYVNNQLEGTGSWKGRLNPGVYTLEAKLEKYRTAKQDIEVIAGDSKTVELQPTPIYGSIDISTIPIGATITINGKDYGTTPNTINKMMIGDYTVQLTKPDYATVNKTISITDGKSTEIAENLSNGRTITITSTPAGASLFIDENKIGTTPYNGSLTFGNHTLKIENEGKKAEKIVSINQTGGKTNFTLLFGSPPVTDIDGNVYKTVTIGTQTWMAENLKTTHYQNGDPIPNVTENATWTVLITGARCDYNNNIANGKKLGHLYNC